MKGKAVYKNFILILFFVMILGYFFRPEESKTKSHIERLVDLSLRDGNIIDFYDSHGGFHGDGSLFAVIQFQNQAFLKKVEDKNCWHKLPLSSNVEEFIFNFCNLSNRGDWDHQWFPKISEGYYYFKDNHSEAIDKYSDKEIFNRYSHNLLIGVFDTSKNRLYVLKSDS